jgi:hypothetical protein
MGKSISERIHDSFISDATVTGEDVSDSTIGAKEYAEKLLSAWKDISTVLRKSVILIFLLMAVFELLAYQSSSKGFTIGSFSFANSSVVLIFLPTVIGYMIFDSYLNTKQWLDLERAYRALTRLSAPEVSDNDLDLLLRPPLPPLWTVGSAFSPANATMAENFIYHVVALSRTVALLILPLAFEVQAYYHLFNKYGYANVLIWLNAAVTLTLAVCYGIILMLSNTRWGNKMPLQSPP